MGTVKKRGGVYWHRDPVSGKRRSTGYRNKKAAELYHAQREQEAADPDHGTKDAATLGDWVTRMLESKADTKSAGTMNMYQVKSGHLVRVFGQEFPLRKFTPIRVGDYISQRRGEGASRSTIYRETVALSQILKLARHSRAWDGDPKALMPIGWSPGYKPRKHNLTPPQVMALLGAMTEEQRAWAAFVIATSARLGEADRSEPGDLDKELMVCRVRGTKTASSERWVPVLAQFAPLWAIVGDFWDKHGRGPRWPRASKGIGEAAKRAGLPHTTPNDLRRTNASWLIQTGVDQGLVSRVLGHRDQTMVHRVYGQMSPKQLAASVQEQVDRGTKSTQSAFFEALGESKTSSKQLKAPWRNGRRGGFKILPEGKQSPQLTGTIESDGDGWGWSGTGGGTKEAQLLSLAGVAHLFGVLPVRVVTEQAVERRAAEMRGAA